MERIIEIGGKACRMKTSAALPRLYRRQLGREIFEDMAKVGAVFNDAKEKDGETIRIEMEKATPEQLEALEYIENLAYIMNKHADPTQPETVEEWLEQFDDAGAVFDVVFDIILLWLSENRQTAEPQKKTGRSTGR